MNKKEPKICPKYKAAAISKGGYYYLGVEVIYCDKEACAWWDEKNRQCVVMRKNFNVSLAK